MRKAEITKYQFTVTEWRLIMRALNTLRNGMLARGEYTDFVDEVLVKFASAASSQTSYRSLNGKP
jgi:hypothetical protein